MIHDLEFKDFRNNECEVIFMSEFLVILRKTANGDREIVLIVKNSDILPLATGLLKRSENPIWKRNRGLQ